MKIIHLTKIKQILQSIDIIPAIEEGFVAYSKGNAIIPPVGELLFKEPPGDVHIKYGYILGNDFYLVKIASGFYDNPKLNLPSSNGLMLLFSQKTGLPLAILLDEGYLTDLRTAAAGAICAKYLAPKHVSQIGIIGTGTQARLQLLFLKKVVQCTQVKVWGRDKKNLLHFQEDMEKEGFKIQTTQQVEDITSTCNLIVTTTSAASPILFSRQIKAGTHITAVGADTIHKQELEESIFGRADVIVADSISQCVERGDISHAIRKKIINEDKISELGNIISVQSRGRISDNQLTIADLTGLAVQDIQIAKIIYTHN